MYCVKCKSKTDTKSPIDEFTAKNGIRCARGVCKGCGTVKTSFVKGKKGAKRKDGKVIGEGMEVTDDDRPDMEKYARFAASTYIPELEREDWLRNEGLEGYILDNELSDAENTVFVNPETKELIFGARGSKTAKDWLVDDALIAAGATDKFNYAPRYKSTKRRIQQALEKYPDYKPMLSGHSLGSTLISTAGSEMKIPFRGYSTGSSPMGWSTSIGNRLSNWWNPDNKKWLKDNARTYNVWTDPVSISDTVFPVWDTAHYNISKQKRSGNPHSITNFYPALGSGLAKLKKHCPFI
jgi:hypothetical protein